MTDQLTSWQPDPWGLHEFRFFSGDGKPTQLVMDGGRTSYDKPPATSPPPAALTPSTPEFDSRPSTESPPETAAERGSQVATTAGVLNLRVEPDQAVGAPKQVHRVVPPVVEFPDYRSLAAGDRSPEPLSQPRKIAYIVVCAVLAVSVLGLAYVHLRPTGSGHSTQAAKPTTTSSAPRATTTTTVALPSARQPGAEAAATALISSWSTGNKTAALTVATPTAVADLFAAHYTSGLAIDRGCSTTFMPIVCTFGPPGGASPTDPIYEIDVTQAAGGWYVSSVKIEN